MDSFQKLKNDSEWIAGDKPPYGMYACLDCDPYNPNAVFISEDNPELKPCTVCGGEHWYRI